MIDVATIVVTGDADFSVRILRASEVNETTELLLAYAREDGINEDSVVEIFEQRYPGVRLMSLDDYIIELTLRSEECSSQEM